MASLPCGCTREAPVCDVHPRTRLSTCRVVHPGLGPGLKPSPVQDSEDCSWQSLQPPFWKGSDGCEPEHICANVVARLTSAKLASALLERTPSLSALLLSNDLRASSVSAAFSTSAVSAGVASSTGMRNGCAHGGPLTSKAPPGFPRAVPPGRCSSRATLSFVRCRLVRLLLVLHVLPLMEDATPRAHLSISASADLRAAAKEGAGGSAARRRALLEVGNGTRAREDAGAEGAAEAEAGAAGVHMRQNAGVASVEAWVKEVGEEAARSITSLDLSHNAIPNVAQLAAACPRLEDVRLGNNALHHDPAKGALAGLHTLQSVGRTLRTLSLRGNAIASDDAGSPAQSPYLFANLRALVSLDLARCALVSLPNVAGCVALQKLDVSGNRQLVSLADAPTRLPRNLCALRLHSTGVRSVLHLKYLTPFVNLRELTLANTPLAETAAAVWRIDHRTTALAILPRLVSLDGEAAAGAAAAWVSCARGVFRQQPDGPLDANALALLADDCEEELLAYLARVAPSFSPPPSVRYAAAQPPPATTPPRVRIESNVRASAPVLVERPASAEAEMATAKAKQPTNVAPSAINAMASRVERAEVAAAAAERRAAAAEKAARGALAAVAELQEQMRTLSDQLARLQPLASTPNPTFDFFRKEPKPQHHHVRNVEPSLYVEPAESAGALPLSPLASGSSPSASPKEVAFPSGARADDDDAVVIDDDDDDDDAVDFRPTESLEVTRATAAGTPGVSTLTTSAGRFGTTPSWLATAAAAEASSAPSTGAPEATPSWLAAAMDEVEVMPPSRLVQESGAATPDPAWLTGAVDGIQSSDTSAEVSSAGETVTTQPPKKGLSPPSGVKRAALAAARAAVR